MFIRAVSVENSVYTMKYFAGLYFLTIVTSCSCQCFLIWSVVNFIFLWPLAYKSQSDRINDLFIKVKENASMVVNKVDKLIPKYVEKIKEN